jgi:hypothetical protein
MEIDVAAGVIETDNDHPVVAAIGKVEVVIGS